MGGHAVTGAGAEGNGTGPGAGTVPLLTVRTRLSLDDLLEAVGRLELPELERFVADIIALRARRAAPALPQSEAELLQEINLGMPPNLQRRYDELIARRQAERLTAAEHAELLRLTDQIEAIDARGAELLAQLAELRGVPLSRLLAELGAPPRRHG